MKLLLRAMALTAVLSATAWGAGSAEAGRPIAPAADAPSRTAAVVSGRIVDTAGRGVPNVSIQLCSSDICMLGNTDAAGQFTIRNVPPGNYELKFPVAGNPAEIRAVPVRVQAGERLLLPDVGSAAGELSPLPE